MKIPRRKKKEKKSSLTGGINSDTKTYLDGAFLGAIVGGIGGLILGKKIIWGIVIGAVAGGYIAFKLNNDDSSSIGIKKFTQNKNEENVNN